MQPNAVRSFALSIPPDFDFDEFFTDYQDELLDFEETPARAPLPGHGGRGRMAMQEFVYVLLFEVVAGHQTNTAANKQFGLIHAALPDKANVPPTLHEAMKVLGVPPLDEFWCTSARPGTDARGGAARSPQRACQSTR